MHSKIRKKEKPYKIISSKNRDVTSEVVILLEKDDEVPEESVKSKTYNKSARKDYRTEINPNFVVRSYLLSYFISRRGHTLTAEQIEELIYKTEGLSWYSIEQLVQDAYDKSASSDWKLNEHSFLCIANKYNIVLSNNFNQKSITEYNADDLIKKLYNEHITSQATDSTQDNLLPKSMVDKGTTCLIS